VQREQGAQASHPPARKYPPQQRPPGRDTGLQQLVAWVEAQHNEPHQVHHNAVAQAARQKPAACAREGDMRGDKETLLLCCCCCSSSSCCRHRCVHWLQGVNTGDQAGARLKRKGRHTAAQRPVLCTRVGRDRCMCDRSSGASHGTSCMAAGATTGEGGGWSRSPLRKPRLVPPLGAQLHAAQDEQQLRLGLGGHPRADHLHRGAPAEATTAAARMCMWDAGVHPRPRTSAATQ
jgi:hypothetical protein